MFIKQPRLIFLNKQQKNFMTYLANIGFFTLLKLFFIILLLIINIYLIIYYCIYNYNNKPNTDLNNFKMSSFLNKFVKQYGALFTGTVGLYASYKTISQSHEELNKEAISMINEAQELAKNECKEKTTIIATFGRLRIKVTDYIYADKKKTLLEQEIENKQNEYNNIQDLNQKTNLQSALEHLKKDLKYWDNERLKTQTEILGSLKEIEALEKGNKFINFNLFSFFEKFNAIQQLAISMIFLNSVIFSALITIIFVFYGDFLIKKFDLENKHPLLTKFIRFRTTMQRYYLFSSIFVILLVLLIQVTYAIAVLSI